jgi:hypothetical protein
MWSKPEHGHPASLALLVALPLVAALWAGLGLWVGRRGPVPPATAPAARLLPLSHQETVQKDRAQ